MGVLSSFLFLTLHSSYFWMFVFLLSLFYSYMRFWIGFYDTNMGRTDNLTFLITGAESGIGRHTADLLACRGGRIIMACKNTTLGNKAKEQIVTRTLNQNVEVKHLDMSSFDSVRKFAKEIHQTVDKLDVLVNNYSNCDAAATKTADGLNSIMQENHFGPFLLTNLLLELLKKSSPSRIVFVSSILHQFHKFDLNNLNNENEQLPSCRLYFNAKLANILTAKYFARMLQGTGVTVNSLHPGMVRPDPSAGSSGCSGIISMLFSLWINIIGKTPLEGAMTSTYVASEPKLQYVTGEHFADCKISHCVAKIASDKICQERLFEKSVQIVKLKPEERYL